MLPLVRARKCPSRPALAGLALPGSRVPELRRGAGDGSIHLPPARPEPARPEPHVPDARAILVLRRADGHWVHGARRAAIVSGGRGVGLGQEIRGGVEATGAVCSDAEGGAIRRRLAESSTLQNTQTSFSVRRYSRPTSIVREGVAESTLAGTKRPNAHVPIRSPRFSLFKGEHQLAQIVPPAIPLVCQAMGLGSAQLCALS
mmetsp:Transcript_38664/g.101032  ORF Transcript_38664/g.101032 Transcript_38664/m.101032 type:complete len:202 (+) Transcript_38664:4443-5048(+)